MKYQYSLRLVLLGILICVISAAIMSTEGKSPFVYYLFNFGFVVSGIGVFSGWIRMIYLKLSGKKLNDDYKQR